MALFHENDRLAARKIPAGALIKVETDPFHDGRLISVKWGNNLAIVFDEDLKSHSKLDEAAGEKAGRVGKYPLLPAENSAKKH